jgi:hypothetical protein
MTDEEFDKEYRPIGFGYYVNRESLRFAISTIALIIAALVAALVVGEFLGLGNCEDNGFGRITCERTK